MGGRWFTWDKHRGGRRGDHGDMEAIDTSSELPAHTCISERDIRLCSVHMTDHVVERRGTRLDLQGVGGGPASLSPPCDTGSFKQLAVMSRSDGRLHDHQTKKKA